MSDMLDSGDVVASPIAEEPIYSASDLIEEYSRNYLHEIYHNHFPSEIDGFKTIFRRYIYALYLKNLTRTIMKSARAVAELTDAHPYNDTSMYEVIMRMAQPWVYYPPLVNSASNIGTYSGNTTASSRYTSSGLSEFTRDIYLEGIDVGAIPRVEGASLDLEPQFFIPAIPMALAIDNLTIGYGKGCLTARLNLGNVCDLVTAYAEHKASGSIYDFPAHLYADKFLPDFPTPCLITNWRDLQSSYANGNYEAVINMAGRVTITKDQILVQSLPHGLPFVSAIKAIQEHIIDNKNGSLDRKIKNANAPRSKKMLGNLKITPRQGVSTLQLWKEIAPLIRFSGRFHPNPNYQADGKYVTRMSYPTVLKRWYKERHALVMSTRRRRLQTLSRQKWIAEAHLVVVNNTDRCIEIIRESINEAAALDAFKKEFGLTPFQGTELLNQNLRVLARTAASKLHGRIEALTQSIKDLTDSFLSISNDVSKTAQTIKKKYEKGRVSHLPDYIGYVAMADGIILFESADEVSDILEAFPKESVRIYALEHDRPLVINEQGKIVDSDLHKYMYGDVYGLDEHYLSGEYYTVVISDEGARYNPGIKPSRRLPGVFYTKEFITGLTRDGKVRYMKVSELSKRRNALQAQGAKSDLVHVHTTDDGPFYIAQMNTADKNVVHIQKVMPGQTSYVTSPVGETTYYYSKTGKDWFIAPPDNCLWRCSTRVIHIPDADEVIPEGRNLFRYDLNAKTRRNAGVRQYQ